MIGVLWSKTWC